MQNSHIKIRYSSRNFTYTYTFHSFLNIGATYKFYDVKETTKNKILSASPANPRKGTNWVQWSVALDLCLTESLLVNRWLPLFIELIGRRNLSRSSVIELNNYFNEFMLWSISQNHYDQKIIFRIPKNCHVKSETLRKQELL